MKNDESATIAVIIVACICAIGLCFMISTTLPDDDTPLTTSPPQIFIPLDEEREQGERILIGSPMNATDADGNRVRCWFYESKDVARNRPATMPVPAELPDYELPK
jgi:hypothetical protein